MIKYVYVVYNPLYERVVCVHDTQSGTCKKCNKERKLIENTAYWLNRIKLKIRTNKK